MHRQHQIVSHAEVEGERWKGVPVIFSEKRQIPGANISLRFPSATMRSRVVSNAGQ
jgi:hypothetical protein